MKDVSAMTGRERHIVEYYGDPEAENITLLMGSGAENV
jgi:pyruvate/2-oxoacid:ferredoxin oxidoreductase alpha subunit